jgi:starch synthase
MAQKFKTLGIGEENLSDYKNPTYVNISKIAMDYSDGIIFGSQKINPELETYAKQSGKPVLEYKPLEDYIDAYNEFYDEINVQESVLSQ